MKRSSLSIESFKELIDKDAYYIDKTQLIVDCIKEKCVLYTRPRRFGKTLNMSMLYYFFSNQESDNAYLFDGLKVTQYPEVMKHQNQYPVIFLTFKDLSRESMELQTDKFASMIASVVRKYPELLSSSQLDDDEKEMLLQYRKKKSTMSELRDALLNISICLQKHYLQKSDCFNR